jgi:DHA1 family tetracycline resistance protein-like MFS transporter
VLLLGRLLAGIAGSSIATANALVADVSNDENRVKNFGMVGAVFGLGMVIGPGVGSALSLLSLRAPLIAVVAIAWVLAILGFVGFGQTSKRQRREADSLKTKTPVALLRKHPFLLWISAAVLLTSLAQRGLENLFVVYTSVRFEWGRFEAGMLLCLLGLASALIQGMCAKAIIERFGQRGTAIASSMILMGALAAIAIADQGLMLYPIFAIGAFSGLAGPALQALVTRRLDSREQGQTQGIFVSVVSLSGTAAPFLFTSLLFAPALSNNQEVWISTPFVVGAGLVSMAVILLYAGLPIDCLDEHISQQIIFHTGAYRESKMLERWEDTTTINPNVTQRNGSCID